MSFLVVLFDQQFNQFVVGNNSLFLLPCFIMCENEK